MWKFLLAAVLPLVKKVLLGLGIGWISYSGATLLMSNVIAQVQGAWGGMTGTMLQIASLAGIPESLGIICGALTARVALVAVDRFGKVATQ